MPKIPSNRIDPLMKMLKINANDMIMMETSSNFETNVIIKPVIGGNGGKSTYSVKKRMNRFTESAKDGNAVPKIVNIMTKIIIMTKPKYFLSSTFDSTKYAKMTKGTTKAITYKTILVLESDDSSFWLNWNSRMKYKIIMAIVPYLDPVRMNCLRASKFLGKMESIISRGIENRIGMN